MVIANLIIEPADVYILRGDVVHYKIIQVRIFSSKNNLCVTLLFFIR